MKFFICSVMLSLALGMYAVPAKRGIWKTLRLADGKQVSAQLTGDDIMHYYQSESGDCYVAEGKGEYKVVDKAVLVAHAKARREVFDRANRVRARQMKQSKANVFEGKKKGLIVLVQFSDKKFKDEHNLEFYKRLANEPGFTTEDGFNGSVRDYFKAQSRGTFDVEFDVVGPVTMPNSYIYYGKNVGLGDDARVGEMVAEACKAIDADMNFADYDWNGDGEVEQVFAIYAGLGENAGGSDDTIWPHKWTLADSDYRKVLTLDNTNINTYACGCEMTLDSDNDYKETVDGIGTICHEFSHCLGYPDMYDTSQFGGNNFGMDVWDLMDYGSYNNGGFTPSGYTAYEKWVAGWIEPVELTESTIVDNLQPTSDGGDAYIIYNSGKKDEFIILENRQQTGWDAAQPSSGLMALHVDYDLAAWTDNTVNNDKNHQRCTILHADNSDGSEAEDLAGDLYPYAGNDCINSVSYPKPLWYNSNADGKKSLGMSISDITLNTDGTVSFAFHDTPVERGDFLFLETFDDCSGRGGNDGDWFSVGGSVLIADTEGWEGVKHYAGAQCARFGTKSTPGSLLSPEVGLEKGAVLTCLAGPWSGEKSVMTVTFVDSGSGAETVLGTFDIVEDKWKECEMPLNIDGVGRLKFSSSMRQFLDEVRITSPALTGIEDIADDKVVSDKRVYSIDGRYLGDEIDSLGHGLYIVGGKKILK